jgi:hypothetical protein
MLSKIKNKTWSPGNARTKLIILSQHLAQDNLVDESKLLFKAAFKTAHKSYDACFKAIKEICYWDNDDITEFMIDL